MLTAALLITGALTMTACGPDDSGKKDDASSSASSTAAPSNGKEKQDGSADKKKGDCPVIAKGHKVIQVTGVEGAMNNVLAKDAKMACSPSMNEGASYHPSGPVKTYHWTPQAKMTVITKDGPKQVDAHGIGHVKTCADPDGKQYDGGQTKPQDRAKEFCNGGNFYDVVVGSGDTITEMTELYSS
ncbi:hypothetical protein [Streptomyces orinoci]|uniref:Lipoprotein n=1 Tax=Streptomyces orinoci TaxID=67339 RepID=A0ABV3K7I5_STRON|nr:hypothetical protein [Streptomyces orinoci]